MFFGFVRKRLNKGKKGNLKNGVIYFKGGELEPELVRKKILPSAEFDIEKFFGDSRFEGKRISHFPTELVLKA
jgi:16S rRNA (guanine527-N7)-methyltransferase